MAVNTKTLAFRLKEMMLAYPSLFPTEDHAINHLYLVIGNGYDWINGRLDEKYEEPTDTGSIVKKMLIAGASDEEIKAHVKVVHREKYGERFGADMEALLIKLDMALPWENESHSPVAPYPVCEYSKVMTVPENAKRDWVEGAYRAALIAIVDPPLGSRDAKDNVIWICKAVARLDKMFGCLERPRWRKTC